MNFHHVGVAVTDIDNSAMNLAIMGVTPTTGKTYDGGQDATLQMFDSGGVNVELIEGNAVKGVLGGDTFKIYHVCFEVENLLDMVGRARAAGYIRISSPKSAPLFDDRQVVFMMNKDNFIVEFLEAPIKEKVRI